MIYAIVIIALLILTYYYDYRRNTYGRLFWYVVMFAVLVLVAGLRYRLGTDSVRYERYFTQYIPALGDLKLSTFTDTRFSPVYVVLNSTVRTFTDQFVYFQLVHAIIVNGIVFYFFYKYTQKIFFAVLVYLFFKYTGLNMEVLREALAVCVFLLAWPAFRDGKWLLWYALSFLCFFCHTSGVIMFFTPLIVVPGIRSIFTIGKRTIVFCILLCVVTFIVRVNFFRYVEQLAVIDSVVERVHTYAETELASSNLNFFGILLYFGRWVVYPLFALFILCYKDHPMFKNNDRFVAMTMMSIYIGIISMAITIFYRFNNYFIFFAFLVVSDLIYTNFTIGRRRYKFRYLTWIMIFVPYFFLQVYTVYLGNVNKSGTLKTYMNYYPYASRLDMDKDEDREKVFRHNHAY